MSYTSKQINEALHELAQKSSELQEKTSGDEGAARKETARVNVRPMLVIPAAVAAFLKQESQYAEATKSISVGVY